MGCLQSMLKPSHPSAGRRCLDELNQIDNLLKEMVAKYDRQRVSLDGEIRMGLRRNEDKAVLLQKLRQKRIVIHYMGKVRDRINTIMQKKYAIEQLNLTAMQVQALKHTSSLFKDFNKKNNIDKIEELNDTMQELTEQVLEIGETLGSEPLIDIDDDELLNELNELCSEPEPSIVSTIGMPMAPENDVEYQLRSKQLQQEPQPVAI